MLILRDRAVNGQQMLEAIQRWTNWSLLVIVGRIPMANEMHKDECVPQQATDTIYFNNEFI